MMAQYQCLNCCALEEHGVTCCESPDLFAVNDMPAEIKRLRALSVENIMLAVTPGFDGMGHEVYAKSVHDVTSEMSVTGARLEDLGGERETLFAQLATAQAREKRLREQEPVATLCIIGGVWRLYSSSRPVPGVHDEDAMHSVFLAPVPPASSDHSALDALLAQARAEEREAFAKACEEHAADIRRGHDLGISYADIVRERRARGDAT